jgi:hypothetical protein
MLSSQTKPICTFSDAFPYKCIAVLRYLYTVKKSFSIFPSPAGMPLTKLSLGGNYDVIYKLLLPRESLVSDIPAGDENIEKFFYSINMTGIL